MYVSNGSAYRSASALRHWHERQAIDKAANTITASTGLNRNTTTDAIKLRPMKTRGRTKMARKTRAKKPAAMKHKIEKAERNDAIM